MKLIDKGVYVKVVASEWKNASHDKRELKIAEELGYQTVVVANTKDANDIYNDEVEGFKVVRISTRKFGQGLCARFIGRIRAIIKMAIVIKGINSKVISGHDYSGWLIGYLGKKRHTKLIYDSHELELYQAGWTPFRYKVIKILEEFILKRSAITYTVTACGANIIKEIYRLEKTPIVARNIPEYVELDVNNVNACRKEFMSHLAIKHDDLIIVYHGGFSKGRGIEQAIDAVAKIPNIGLVMIGYALDNIYFKSIVDKIDEYGCRNRVYIKSSLPLKQLFENVAAADIGIVLSRNTCLNHYFSLPNKLFETIQAGTPVIASDFPEIYRIIREYDVGVVVDPDDIVQVTNVLILLSQDKMRYKRLKENVKKAKQHLCWQNEKVALVEALERLSD